MDYKAFFLLLWLSNLTLSLTSREKISNFIQNQINGEKTCHVHLINNRRGFILDGILESPLTIQRNKAMSIPLQKAKGFNCVLLLIVEIHSKVRPSKPKYTWYLWHFSKYFIKSLHHNETSRLVQLTNVILLTKQSLKTLNERFHKTSLIKFIGVAILTFNKKNKYLKSYMLCIFCGVSVPFLHPFKFSLDSKLSLLNQKEILQHFTEKSLALTELTGINRTVISSNVLRSIVQGRKNIFKSAKFFAEKWFYESAVATKIAELFMLEELAHFTNATLHFCLDGLGDFMCKSTHRPSIQVLEPSSVFYFTDTTSDVDGSLRIQLGQSSQSFLTCYQTPLITYAFYIKPFQLELWMTFFAFILTIYSCIKLVIWKQFGLNKFGGYSVFLFVISTITDDTYGLPAILSRCWKIRFTVGPWFLASVIFVNAYVGIAISSLTTPFEQASIDSFKNLTRLHYNNKEITRKLLWSHPQIRGQNKFCSELEIKYEESRELDLSQEFIIYSSMKPVINMNYSDPRVPRIDSLFLWVVLQNFWSTLYHYVYDNFNSNMVFCEAYLKSKQTDITAHLDLFYTQRKLLYSSNWENKNELMFNLLFPFHASVPKHGANAFRENVNSGVINGQDVERFAVWIEEDITKCERTVFADETKDVEIEFNYLSNFYPDIKFFKSKDTFLQKVNYWIFPEAQKDSKFFQKVQVLVSSGIYYQIENYFLGKLQLVRNKRRILNGSRTKVYNPNSPKAVSLGDRVQTCFLIYCACILVCVCFAMREIFYYGLLKWGGLRCHVRWSIDMSLGAMRLRI